MKQKLLLVILVLLSVFFKPHAAKADHSAGGELLYEWINDSTYRFYLKFYRDCKGIEPYDIVYVCYKNSCNPANADYLTLTKMAVLPDGSPNGAEVNPGCPGVKTRCAYSGSQTYPPPVIPAGTLPGYREWWYTGTVTLHTQCNAWTFYISINARNGADNIGSTFDNLYIEATLDNLDAPHQSSSYFTVKPVPYVCINQPVSYSVGPVDPDGDSLSYDFIMPRSSTGLGTGANGPGVKVGPGLGGPSCPVTATTLSYYAPYSIANPFSTGSTFKFDARTGVMTFIPTMLSVNAVALQVGKWRNRKKIGSVMRDIQFNVVACTNAPIGLRIDTARLFNSFYEDGIVIACVNKPFGFRYIMTSTTKGTILVASDNHFFSAPGSGVLYLNNATDSVTGVFSWTPADTGIFLLSVTVRDSTCRAPGVSGTQTFVIPIHVRGMYAAYRKIPKCGTGTLVLTSNGDAQILWSVLPGGSPASSIACPTCKSTIVTPTMHTVYVSTFSASKLCAAGDTVDVNIVDNDISITPAGPLVLCKSDTLKINALATGPKPLVNLACGLASTPPSILLDTVTVLPANPPPPALAGTQSGTNAASTPFNGNYVTAHHQYLVKAADMLGCGMQSGALKSLSFKLSGNQANAKFSNLVISLKCTTDTLDTAKAFMAGAVPVYTATGIVTLPTTAGYVKFNFNSLYNWDTTQDLLVDVCYANTTTVPLASVYYFNTAYAATKFAYNTSGNVCNGGPVVVAGARTRQLPMMRFEYYAAPEYPDFSYRWGSTRDNLFTPSDTIRNTVVYVNKPTKLYVSTRGRNGCAPSDTLEVFVSNHGYRISRDTTICVGVSVPLWVRDTTADSSMAHSWQWYEGNNMSPATSLSCNTCANTIATPTATTTYTLVASDSVNCSQTMHVTVNVNPLPEVHVITRDTTIGFGTQLQLLARGADTYVWFPVSTLNSPNIPNPIATAEDSTYYSVIGIKAGCQGTDSVLVRVDREGRVFIPSAFTPNGDGKNDVFKVVNISFQKVLEFRVYNRWGQELYHTTDPKAGWDGTWKGIPQDMGTYCYLIRLAYPDGDEKNYKGNVTLIR